MAIRVSLSAKGNHLVFAEATFEDGIALAGSAKIGVLEIEDPKKGEATLKKAQKMDWAWGDEVEGTDFFLVERA